MIHIKPRAGSDAGFFVDGIKEIARRPVSPWRMKPIRQMKDRNKYSAVR